MKIKEKGVAQPEVISELVAGQNLFESKGYSSVKVTKAGETVTPAGTASVPATRLRSG